jgi:hypothetical protein
MSPTSPASASLRVADGDVITARCSDAGPLGEGGSALHLLDGPDQGVVPSSLGDDGDEEVRQVLPILLSFIFGSTDELHLVEARLEEDQ